MTEQNELAKISKSPFSIGIQASVAAVIIFVLIWGGIRINTLNQDIKKIQEASQVNTCLLYTSTSPRDRTRSRMPSSA